jgi:DNA-binding CsgD family transcriptional regulator
VGLLNSYRNFERPLLQLQKLLKIAAQPLRPEHVKHQVKRARQLRPEELVDLTARYEAGASMNELAKCFGIHRTTISKHLTEMGAQVRDTRIKVTQVKEARKLYESGMSLADIGSRLGFDNGTIHNHLRRAGVQMRDTHGRER